MLNREVVYDIEVMPNVFLLSVLDLGSYMKKTFVLGEWGKENEFEEMKGYIQNLVERKYLMIGFNNYHYDYPVLHYILTSAEIDNDNVCERAYERSCEIIEEAKKGNRFVYTIWDSEMIVPQLDLFKIHHFDNKAKTVSLKRLEFNMRMSSIEEFKGGFAQTINSQRELKELIDYNIHDLLATHRFYEMSEEEVSFRKGLVDSWGNVVLNYNDTKLGEKLIERRLKEELGIRVLYDYEEGDYGETIRTMKQTLREFVDLADIIFPNISFYGKPLRDLLRFLKTLRVFVNGMRFEWSDKIDYLEGKAIIKEKELELSRLEKKSPKWCEVKEEIKSLEELYQDCDVSVSYNGATFEIGKGGIHSAVPWGVFRKRPGYKILDVDVASFYPSIAIEYEMKPEHLPDEFVSIYKTLKEERMIYKKTDPAKAQMLKLALNGTYGKTNSIYSVLYDPEYSLKTVINGQLMLLMLWDMLVYTLSTVELIQANTDGISFIVKERDESLCKQVLQEWEERTHMVLESVEYESMFIRDVNNYVAKDIHGKIKAKGAYNWMELYTGSKGRVVWYKNHSNVISQKAACAFLLEGRNIEEYIREQRNVFDFFLCTNVNRSSRLYWGEEEVQRNTRYLVCNHGEELIKVMPPLKGKDTERRIAINKGWLTTIHNRFSSVDISKLDISYDFYIQEAKELVKGFKL